MKDGQLYIISAPSGAGKTSLLNALRGRLQYVRISISHTTRPPRPTEKHGWHYYFVDKDNFQQEIAADNFLEYAEVFGNYYGTSRSTVNGLLSEGYDVILEIDWQGAQQVRQRTDDAISIFILPPSVTALEKRLRQRAQDDDQVIQKRMQQAYSELSHHNEYDYLVINDDFETALEQLLSIFQAERLRLNKQQQHHQDLLDALVK